MKKLFTFFFIGQMIICGYIFNKSIFEIYTLNNFGDPSLNKYSISMKSDLTSDKLENLYDYLINNENKIQVIKMPISNTNELIFKIYNSDDSNVNKLKGISDNVFEYYQLTKNEFIDSTGFFYSNISKSEFNTIHDELGIDILEENKEYISYKRIITDNLINFIILIVLSQTVILVYTLTRGKVNAIKKMLGHSSIKIINSILNDFVKIEGIIFISVVIINSLYYILHGKFSLLYIKFLMLFLLCIIAINILMLLLTQISIKRLDINSAVKNRIYSEGLNITMKVVKVFLIILSTVSITICIKYYKQIEKYSQQYVKYNALNDLYSSYGFNSDEYSKYTASSEKLKYVADNVKKMYQTNLDKAYFMNANIINYLGGKYLEKSGLTREQVMESYKDNYLILNKNYIKDYIKIGVYDCIEEGTPTILVPKKYKFKESEIKKAYINIYQNLLNYNNAYGIKKDILKINNINVIYIEDDIEYEILSTLRYEGSMDITIKNSIIIVDTGQFDSCFYLDQLSLCNLAFKFDDRNTYGNLLRKYELDSMFKATTMYAPFMEKVTGYKFMMNQSMIFASLFLITLIFVIYMSNYIDICVYRKKYAVMYSMGHSIFSVLKLNFLIDIIMIGITLIIYITHNSIITYFSIIVIDTISLICLYNKLIKKNIYLSINGG